MPIALHLLLGGLDSLPLRSGSLLLVRGTSSILVPISFLEAEEDQPQPEEEEPSEAEQPAQYDTGYDSNRYTRFC